MTRSLSAGILAVAIVALLLFAYISGLKQSPALGAATSGLASVVSTSSVNTIAANAVNSLFATSTCTSRIITTQAGYLELTFNDKTGQSPSGTFGHYQAASTTIAYSSGDYGCGLVKGYSSAAQTITTTETQ